MKKRIDILQPINVSGVYTVLKAPQTLKGFRVTVTYNGRSNINQKHSNKIDVFPTKRGCKFGNVVYDDEKTSVDYIFRDGLFLPDSMARANDFKKDVKEFVNLEPVDVSGVGVWYYSMRSGTWVLNGAVDEDCICMGYGVTVSYPGNLVKNGLLKYYVEQGPSIKTANVQYNEPNKTTDVSYYIANRDFMDRQDAYKHADMFRNMMHCRIAGAKRNENIK